MRTTDLTTTPLPSPRATHDEAVSAIAARHGFGLDATRSMLAAVIRGGGRMAQFDHPEFAGLGQWMSGGMTMVSDLYDSRLKSRIDGLCSDLSDWAARRPDAAAGAPVGEATAPSPPPLHRTAPSSRESTWPVGLGSSSASGSQNGSRYAVFDAARRLAVEQDGRTTLYDTLDHRISGVSQQQGVGGAMRFTSQHGSVDLERLPRVSGSGTDVASGPASGPASDADIPAMIERLADLAARGILGPAEFAAKKTELLARI